jgi:hypothetical protein
VSDWSHGLAVIDWCHRLVHVCSSAAVIDWLSSYWLSSTGVLAGVLTENNVVKRKVPTPTGEELAEVLRDVDHLRHGVEVERHELHHHHQAVQIDSSEKAKFETRNHISGSRVGLFQALWVDWIRLV